MQEQFYKKMIEDAPFGYAYHKIILDNNEIPIDYEYIEVNKAFERLMGLKRKDILNKKITIVLPEIINDSFDWIAFYGKIALNNEEKTFKHYSKALKKHYSVTVRSPEKYYFITIFNDITEQKNTQKQFQVIAENTSDNIAITSFDLKAKYLYVSPSVKSVLGYEPEDLLGKSFFSFIHKNDKKVLLPLLKKYLSSFVTKLLQIEGPNINERIEFRFKNKAGDWRYMQSTINLVGGNIIAVTRDITENKIAKEKLIKNEKIFRTLIENMSDFVFLIDSDLKVITLNNTACELLENKKENIIGKRISDIFPPNISEIYKKQLQNIFKTSESIATDSILQINNTKLYISTRLNPIFDETKKVIAVIGVSRDISKRKKTEEKLKKSEEQLRNLIENLPVGLYRTTTNGTILFANSALASMLEFKSIEELCSTNIVEGNLTYEDQQKLFKEKIDINDNVIGFESAWKKKNGEKIFVRENARVFRDKDGEIIYYEGTVEDITERKKNEEQLKSLSSIVEQSAEGIALIDLNGILIFANKAWCEMHGYKNSTNIIGKSLVVFHNKEQLDNKVFQFNKKVMKYGTYSGEVGHITKNGKIFPTFMTSTLLKDTHGNPYGIAGIAKDITERKKTEKKLKENEKHLKELNATKDKFFSIIAHDLINPIGSIMNFSELLSNSFNDYDNDKKENFINYINESSKHTLDLLQNLLEWSRSQTNRIEFFPEMFSVSKIVDKNIELLKNNANAKIISLVSEVNPTHKVFADKNMISTVVRNLISNAIKFTKTGSVIISSETKGNYINISVIDTGIGIKKEDINNLFKIEESNSTEGTSGEKGTGLGLIICKDFIIKNNGKICIESTTEKGSKFTLSLPVSNNR